MFRTLADHIVHFFTTPDASLAFTSLPFLCAFIIFFNIYLLLIHARRTLLLTYVVIFSLFFAYKANGTLVLLLPATIVCSWLLTRWMQRCTSAARRWLLALNIVVTLLPLLYYKYANFLTATLNDIIHTNFSPLSLVLPLGISFYTFQALSYCIDAYRQQTPSRVTLLEYTFAITFFPTLMAGPITRPAYLIPQLRRPLCASRTTVYTGLWLIMVGLVKKAVISDYLAQFNEWIFDAPADYSGFENLMGILGFSLQIYLDFSGYSDIAIGLASLLGLHLKDNFNAPYKSRNLTEFWRRWHISLSTWFRDYLYFPLGGSRRGTRRTLLNLLIIMLVSGLWHGASWMFVVWGGLHGIGLIIHKLLRPHLRTIPDILPVRILSTLLTFLFVATAWVFFTSPDLATAISVIRLSITEFDPAYLQPFYAARPLWVILLLLGYALHFTPTRIAHRLRLCYFRTPWLIKLLLFLLVVQLVINVSQESVRPFIYAQF